MNKIIFGLQTMVMGGVEKELIAILNHLNPEEWDVSVVVMYTHEHSVLNLLPSYVKVIDLNIDRVYYCSNTATAAKQRFKRGRFFEATSLLFKKVLGIGQTGSNVDISEIVPIEGVFDIAVCFHLHSPLMVRYMSEKVIAKRKLAWIHNDFSTSGFRVDKILNFLSTYQQIIGVSDKITKEFCALCPTLKHKTSVVYNALDGQEILEKSKECIDAALVDRVSDRIFILTVGRLEEQKGYDIAVETAVILKKSGLNFIWAFIGSGSKESEIREKISTLQLDDYMILLGRRENPYSYMRVCDIYVQPSRHEGYPLTVLEAKILCKPIICTNFAGANEQIKNGITGIIVELNNPDEIANAILYYAAHPEICQDYSSVLQREQDGISDFSEIINCLKG